MKTRYRLPVALLLTVSAIIGNLVAIDLFVSIDFLLGGIFSLTALLLLGPVWGIPVAFISSSVTFFLWQHPYGILIFTAEAAFVGLLLKKKETRVFYLDVVYWLLPGSLQIFAFYYGVLGVNLQGTALIALKHGMNGVFNAFCALVLVLLLQLFEKRRHNIHIGRYDFRSVLQILIVGFVLIPLLIDVMVSGWDKQATIRNEISLRLQNQLMTARSLADMNLAESRLQLQELSRQLQGDDNIVLQQPEELHDRLEYFLWLNPDFLRVIVTDGDEVVASAEETPPSNAEAGRAIALEVPLEGIPDAAYALSAQVLTDTVLYGYEYLQGDGGAALLDSQGNILSVAGEPLPRKLHDQMRRHNNQPGSIDIVPDLPRRVTPADQWEDLYFAASAPLQNVNTETLRIILYFSALPYQATIYDSYIRLFMVVFILLLASIIASTLIIRRFLRSLRWINSAAQNLPEKIVDDREVEWPDSIILDFEEISGSFSQAGKQIRGMFQRLQALNLDLEEARHAAEVSSQAKTEFIAGMSHELRTPLNAIIGNAELLPRKDMSPESVQHVAHVIASSGRHLLGMINDILQHAGSYMRDLPVERRSVSIPVMVRDLELMFRMKAVESGVQLVTEVDGESSGVWVIPERAVMQILVNLMHNAVKHTQDGEVRLAVEKHQDKLRFSVSDTGSGIPYDDQPYIFTPFYQAGEVSTKKEGLGLGLSICSQLLDAMGSRMEMKSTPGKGSVFSFAIEVEQDFSAVDVTPATVEEAAPKLPPDMQVPDGEVLEKLQHLARIGDIAGADHLLRADIAPQPQFSEFYELVRLKLEDFALPELVEILQRLLLRK